VSETSDQQTPASTKERFGSALARVQAQRQGIVAKEFLTLRVPGYEDLRVRYRLVPERQSEEVGRKIESAQRSGASGKKAMEIAADFLVLSCDAILVRVEDGGEFEEIVDDHDRKVRFDAEFADLMGIPQIDEARELVLEVFSPEGEDGQRRNPDSIMDHLNAIGLWRKGRLHEIDGDLLGE
jgi:hypothetical protein